MHKIFLFIILSAALAQAVDFSVPLTGLYGDPLQLQTTTKEYNSLQARAATLAACDTTPRHWLVQFTGPFQQQWRQTLQQLDCVELQYLKQYCLVIRASEKVVVTLTQQPFVRWAGPYRSEYKLSAWLPRPGHIAGEADMNETSTLPMIIKLFRGVSPDNIVERVRASGGSIRKQSSEGFTGRYIEADVSPALLEELAAQEDVCWIEPYEMSYTDNDIAREKIVNVRPAWARGFWGDGQTVCVADSGLDLGSTETDKLHIDFRYYYQSGWPPELKSKSRVVRIDDLFGDGPQDVNGHGTHVAGTVLGAGYGSGANTLLTPTNCFAGIAPRAMLMFQSMGSNSTGSSLPGVPASMQDLLMPAWNAGARVHQNSWSSNLRGRYDTMCETLDAFVGNPLVPKWDDMVVVFAAGNAAEDYVTNSTSVTVHGAKAGVMDLDSIGRPGTSKNCITVGASENFRPSQIDTWWDVSAFNPITSDRAADNTNGMCAFSSRGPCDDLRIKPDIVAPGSWIISTRSRAAPGDRLWGIYPGNTNYLYSGGTSMSAPLVSGAATLIREWLFKDHGISKPSAALVKALLLNNTAPMYKGQYSDDFREIPPMFPNNVNGYGRLNIAGVVDPPSGDERLWWDRPTHLTTGATTEHSFIVHDTGKPLKITLAWSDVPGYAAVNGGLVNDLDMVVKRPGGFSSHGVPKEYRQVLVQDSGKYEGILSNAVNEGYAVKFTPSCYPVRIWGGLFEINWMGILLNYRVNVWDDDGTSGLPGTLLYSTIRQGCSYGWDNVFIPNISIASGSFYIEMRSILDTYPGIIYETMTGTSTSYKWNGSAWSSVSPRQYHIRAIVACDGEGSHDRVNNVQHYSTTSADGGTWTVQVIGHDVWLPQTYALTVSGDAVIPEPMALFGLLAALLVGTRNLR